MVWFDDELFLNCTSMCSPYFEDRHPVLWQKTLCLEHTNGRLKLHVMFYVDGQRNIGGEFNRILVNWIWEWVNHIFLISLHLRLMLKDDWCIADAAEPDIDIRGRREAREMICKYFLALNEGYFDCLWAACVKCWLFFC